MKKKKTVQKVKVKKAVRVLVFSGYGLNCEEETAYGFDRAGGKADIVHINDVIDGRVKMEKFDILAFPGGFAYGDDTGSGKAYGNRVRNHLWKPLTEFIESGKLVIGICNGFQILSQIGILPGAVTFNESNRYIDRWVDLKAEGKSPWLSGIDSMSMPIAHGEGRYIAPKKVLADLKKNKQVAFRYYKGDTATYQDLPANPNGATENIAGVLAYDGRVLGMMPHPDRNLFSVQRPDWPLQKERAKRTGKKLPFDSDGLQIFKNGIEHALKS
jgi:phosphoribosylformylglycinamidine synthase